MVHVQSSERPIRHSFFVVPQSDLTSAMAVTLYLSWQIAGIHTGRNAVENLGVEGNR